MLVNRIVISLLCLSLLSIAHAEESYKQLSHEYDLTFQQFLREKILKLPKHVVVEVYLKDSTVVRGTYEGYQKYDDSFWILPLGKSGLFADDAYDISEIQDVRIIILRNI